MLRAIYAEPPDGGGLNIMLGNESVQALLAAVGGAPAALGYALRTFSMACDQAAKAGPAGRGGVITVDDLTATLSSTTAAESTPINVTVTDDGVPVTATSYQWQISFDGGTTWASATGSGANTSTYIPTENDETGKLRAGPTPNFKQVANGLPGLEMRLPLLFDAMVSKGRLGLEKFVELTATAPAKIYNLHPRKGSIAVGADADIAIWDPDRRTTIGDGMMHDRTGYTPFAGRTVQGWPVTVLSRGRVIVENGSLSALPGSGRFLARSGGEAAKPAGRLVADMDPERNFGAKLL